MKFRSVFSFFVCLLIFLIVQPYSQAHAAENGSSNYIAGCAGTFFGKLPPISGLFLLSQTTYTSSRGLYDGNGDEIGDFDLSVWSETLRIITSYQSMFLGANVYSQLVLPFVKTDSSFGVSGMTLFDEGEEGLSNITVSPVLLQWQKGNTNIIAGLDLVFKGTSYDAGNNANISTGYNSATTVVAIRYDDPDGIDLGIKAGMIFNQENSDTDYKTGEILVLDLFGGWDFGNLQVGIVGGYTQQLSDDEVNGSTSSGHKVKSLVLGPVVTYTKGPITFEFNYQRGLIAENTSKNDSVSFNIAMPLYVPGMKHR